MATPASAEKRPKWKTIAYWVTTILGPFSFIVGGTLFLTGGEQPVSQFTHLGLPLYLLKILGFWKIAGAIVSVLPGLPRLKEWVYAGFFFELTGAAAVHIAVGDPAFADGPSAFGPALLFLVIVMISYVLRPPSRRLPGPVL